MRTTQPEQSPHQPPNVESDVPSRRQFLSRAALLAAAASLGCGDAADRALSPRALSADRENDNEDDGLPNPDRSGIEHIVVLMMENRSFDHMLGWVPRADGRQAGLSYVDNNGQRFHTHELAPDFQGCAFHDPDHSYNGARVQYNNGACDGFLRSGENDAFSIGYYRRQDLAFLGRAATDWTTADRYFAAILGPTFPNRIFQSAAQTDRISNTANPSVLPTIWDRLIARGLTARNYFHDLPTTALWGTKYQALWRPISTFFSDCAAGTLPAVSLLDPQFGGEGAGTSNDDHPFADIRTGEDLMNRIYNAITQSPAWQNTVFVINFDEWGGFFDHVPPPVGPISSSDRAAGYTDGLRGFRTPLLVVSPFARRGYVGHQVYDHTSILRMIEWRWSLDPLTERDATANNLAQLLNFDHVDLHAPQYLVPGVIGAACAAGDSDEGALGGMAGFSASGSTVAERRAAPGATSRNAWRALAQAQGLGSLR
jgi:phospholipase C